MSCSGLARHLPPTQDEAAPLAPGQQSKIIVYHKMQESLEVTLPTKQEEEEKDQPTEMEYLNSRCVLFTYFQGDIGSVVDEHFSRALNQARSFSQETTISRSKTGLNPLWRENTAIASQRSGFPASFWTSSYQTPPPCLSGVHHDFQVTAPGTFSTADASGWPSHALHQTAPPPSPSMSESWHYPLASQVSPSYGHMHDVYMHHHHPHMHHHHHRPTSHLDPRYRPLLMPSVCAAKIPSPQCDATKTDPSAVTSATSAWAGAFHGTVDIVPSFGFDTGIQHQDKSKETSWF
ncbi:transcription cofactor vestigial-like protein 3 [Anolis carolinensis]|uniref:Vestigial like family member 3 n=1 Tax=Anolis carolinensis TaxID=28377 RepID=G1KP20_ANOCA|nr:PREDICTED: transcription cofactor vestigial-like protein 3 [Anolis carolinensis]|eukprot:XP_008105885.1 PREDICTED: transcription cofactor vestigial-like protein 3 [Anolis carolinensis]